MDRHARDRDIKIVMEVRISGVNLLYVVESLNIESVRWDDQVSDGFINVFKFIGLRIVTKCQKCGLCEEVRDGARKISLVEWLRVSEVKGVESVICI